MSDRADPADPIFPAQTCPDCGDDWSGMNPAPSVVPIRAVKPDSLCPICGMTPARVVRVGHELVQQADYLCPSGHRSETSSRKRASTRRCCDGTHQNCEA